MAESNPTALSDGARESSILTNRNRLIAVAIGALCAVVAFVVYLGLLNSAAGAASEEPVGSVPVDSVQVDGELLPAELPEGFQPNDQPADQPSDSWID